MKLYLENAATGSTVGFPLIASIRICIMEYDNRCFQDKNRDQFKSGIHYVCESPKM